MGAASGSRDNLCRKDISFPRDKAMPALKVLRPLSTSVDAFCDQSTLNSSPGLTQLVTAPGVTCHIRKLCKLQHSPSPGLRPQPRGQWCLSQKAQSTSCHPRTHMPHPLPSGRCGCLPLRTVGEESGPWSLGHSYQGSNVGLDSGHMPRPFVLQLRKSRSTNG